VVLGRAISGEEKQIENWGIVKGGQKPIRGGITVEERAKRSKGSIFNCEVKFNLE